MATYHDPEGFREQFEAAGWNIVVMAQNLGVHPTTLRQWKNKHGIEYPPWMTDPRADARRNVADLRRAAAAEPAAEAVVRKALVKAKHTLSVSQLADAVDMSPKRVRDALSGLERRGFNVEGVDEDDVRIDTTRAGSFDPSNTVHPISFAGNEYVCGSISDTHLGSDHERLDLLHAAYDTFEAAGISDVYHGGDLVAGIGVYGARQRTHIHKQTYEEQVEYAVHEYPRKNGIRTHIIGGNHDLEGDFGRIGADPVRAVAGERDDFNYLGKYSAFLHLPNGARIHLLHPAGGSSYAKSYRPQKLVESYTAANKPDALWIAHWHSMLYMVIRGVHTFLLGTTEGQSELGIRKGLGEPAMGFWIHRITMGETGIVKYVPEWHGVTGKEK